MIELNKIYNYHSEYLKCVKIRKSGINTFHVVDIGSNDIIIRKENESGTIIDHGLRIIRCYKCSGCSGWFLPNEIFSYVDESNESITRNAKGYCKNCY